MDLPRGALGRSAVCDCGILDHTHFLDHRVPGSIQEYMERAQNKNVTLIMSLHS